MEAWRKGEPDEEKSLQKGDTEAEDRSTGIMFKQGGVCVAEHVKASRRLRERERKGATSWLQIDYSNIQGGVC